MRRNEFRNLLEQRVLFLDGSYGTELMTRGCQGHLVELLNLTSPEKVRMLHREYIEAGADIIITNTFSANRVKLKVYNLETELEAINAAAVKIARSAISHRQLIFGTIGPTGLLLQPLGELSFSQAYDTFREQASILVKNGVDGLILETFSDLKELKAAILAVRDVANDIPLISQMTVSDNGVSITGTTVEIFASLMNDLEVDVVGLNCFLDPEKMLPVFSQMAHYCLKPLSVEPNAGQPQLQGGDLSYALSPEEFAIVATSFYDQGVNLIGGCCGTGPEHIKKMTSLLRLKKPAARNVNQLQFLSSRIIIKPTEPFLIVGERINASVNKKLQNQIQDGDYSSVIHLAKKQQDEGAAVIDVNPGIEALLSADHIKNLIIELDRQATLPLSFDIQGLEFLSLALEEYAGRPLLNSATAKVTNLISRLNLIRRHGGMLVVLAMEDKVPARAEERIKAIDKALAIIKEQGVGPERIFFDPLVMPLATRHNYRETLETIEYLRSKGLKSIIGLSNLSYNLPGREKINAAFLSLAISSGLKAAIFNVAETITMGILEGSLILQGLEIKKPEIQVEDQILSCLLRGQKEKLKLLIDEKLKEQEPLHVSQQVLSKAMEKIGQLYSSRQIYLPHLLLAAETAQPIFDYLAGLVSTKAICRGKILLATVEGDIHDIGKNIVATVLRSAGIEIVDLGRNVPTETIVSQAEKHKPDIVGLSAMMTTTIGKIKETAEALKSKGIYLPVVAGGASMNREIAERFGVHYASNAIEGLELCLNLIKQKEFKKLDDNIKK